MCCLEPTRVKTRRSISASNRTVFIKAALIRVALIGIAFIGLTLLFSCNEPYTEEPIVIDWDKLSDEGLQGNLAKGVSAAYAALIDGQLIVAGGANFPDKLGFEGGAKVFYDEILWYDPTNNSWKIIGKLPVPSAYGVSIPIPHGALWIGGNGSTELLTTCFKVSLRGYQGYTPETAAIELIPFAPLPAPMDNFAGCAIGTTVYIAGGNINGKPSNALHCINIKNDDSTSMLRQYVQCGDTTWTELPPFPGLPRVQPVLVALQEEGQSYLYLLGGFFGGDAEREPAMATDMLRYNPTEQTWEKVGEQVDPDTDKPFSLGGATAMTVDNRYILCLGGVNHDIFLNAITAQHTIAHDPTLTEEEKRQRNNAFSSTYMTQPISYYRFNPECRLFDTKTGEWITIDSIPHTARAGATLVWDGATLRGEQKEHEKQAKHGSKGKFPEHDIDTGEAPRLTFYVVQGELKPGIRSPETWRGKFLVAR